MAISKTNPTKKSNKSNNRPESYINTENGQIRLISIIDPLDANNKGIDVKKALELRQQGVTYTDIGKVFNVSKQAVEQALRPYKGKFRQLEQYKVNRADILAEIQLEILKSLDCDSIKKASAYQRIGMYGILYDKERLERGESTENVSVIVGAIQELRDKRRTVTVDKSVDKSRDST